MRRVMVIDDEPGIRRTLEIVLKRAGYAVVLAADGAEGLRLCAGTDPDLVITDIHMPGANGLETIAGLRALKAGLPVIAMSGGDQSATLNLLASAALLGAVGTLQKPFTVHEVLEAVQRALGPDSRSAEG